MTDKTALRGRAVALMAEALDLLDRAGEDAAAIYLQQAHDIAARLTALRADDAADPDRRAQERATSLDPALVKAIGGALAVASGKERHRDHGRFRAGAGHICHGQQERE